MELFALKTKFDEQEKELKWAKREAETREKDCKVSGDVRRQDGERSSGGYNRRKVPIQVTTLMRVPAGSSVECESLQFRSSPFASYS